jgi:outer membrane protein OmpA-like peptidoglycan-associated protein
MKKVLALIVLIVLASNLEAQDTTKNKPSNIKPASFALKLGLYDFKKTNNTDGLSKSVVNYGFQYIKGWKPKVDFVASLQFATLKYPYYTSLNKPKLNKSSDYVSLDFALNYKLLTDEHPVVPYLTAGLGLGLDRLIYYTAYAPVGAGLQIKANQGSFIFLQATHNAEASGLTKKHNSYSISYSLPLKLKDKKPVLLPPAPLPVDVDNDGVVDSLDKCPSQKGTIKYFGCPVPDTDKDGVDEDSDKCPNVPGTKKYNGCPIPDTDTDGINDEADKCPTVSGLTRYDGCPIPDTDKDGVNDEADKCPTVAGISANKGCIDVQPILNRVASDFTFKTGTSVLNSKILSKLDSVVSLLNQYPNINLDIIGNTDNVGSIKINMPLSEKRAAVVYKYLVKKKVPAERLSKKGAADSNPIDTNKTSAGRAKNRRTHMNAIYQ